MSFVITSICAVSVALMLVFFNFLNHDKNFKCSWKRYEKFFNFNLPVLLSMLFSTIILIGMVFFIPLSFLLESKAALTGMAVFGIADMFIVGIINISFIIADRVRYNNLLTKYIKRTFDAEKNIWQPEDPVREEDIIFKHADIKKKISKMTKEQHKQGK